MATKTITLTGAEVAVNGLDGANAHIRNDGADVIYAAKAAGITAGADSVLSIPAGQAATVYGISGTVYIQGTGSAQIISNDYSELPFKSAVTLGSVTDSISRAVNNPNLLVNADWSINQEGRISWSETGRMVDRWYKKFSVNTVELSQDGLLFVPAETLIYQSVPLKEYKKLVGKTATFTVKYSGEAPLCVSFTFPDTPCDISYRIRPNADRFWITVYEAVGKVELRFYDPTASHNVEWVKLELGNISTPFCPPDPATELTKCQRYYQIRSTGDIDPVDLRPTMATITDIKQRSDGNYEYIAEL